MKRVALVLMVALSCVNLVSAGVVLRWVVENPDDIHVGDSVYVRLYAVSDGPEDEPFVVLKAIAVWDPAYLELVGLVDGSGDGYPWSYSDFINDSGADGLNDTFEDGDAYYQAWASFVSDPIATPEGLWVVSFEFTALAETSGTELNFLQQYGVYSESAVIDDEDAGIDLLSGLDPAVVRIGSSCFGDIDGDGQIGLGDLSALLSSYLACDGDPNYNPQADLTGDGCVDLSDLSSLMSVYGQDCP